jgi:hypothetical protein
MKILSRLFNFLVLGRFRVEVETPQFLGRQDKYYMLRQVGWLYLVSMKFRPDPRQVPTAVDGTVQVPSSKPKVGAHKVQFQSISQAHSSVVRWL